MVNSEISQHTARVQSVVGGNLADPTIDFQIARSWQRCLLEHKLDPGQAHKPVVLERAELIQRQERLSQLLSVAAPEMTNLYQQVAGSGYAILLTDTDGVVLNYVGDPAFNGQAVDAGLQHGAIWSEAAQGTNGMGTCLVERKPLIIHHDQHFLAKNTSLTCSAAPIFDPCGRMIAVLDASSTSTMAQQHTMVLVNMSAQLIENRLFLYAHKKHYVARFHSRAEFVSTLGEGALSFDNAGLILGANRSALFQLGLDSLEEILGKPVSEIFDVPMSGLVDQASRQPFQPISLRYAHDGRRFFAIIQSAERHGTQTSVTRNHAEPPSFTAASQAEHPLDKLDLGDARIRANIRLAKRLVSRRIPLVLYGETGTGKGVFAKALHLSGNRPDRPFVAVNCAAIPESLIESELFGYKAGAFTGANRQGSRGKIMQAHGGTLFLDEIGDMPLALQARLLRVLEEKEVIPLGSETPVKVDIDIISATHRDLQQLIEAGTFREDLYYRLTGASLTMPALRDRTDKQQLVERILHADGDDGPTVEIDADAMRLLIAYRWPGNIRELSNTLRVLSALCTNGRITNADLPYDLKAAAAASGNGAENPAPSPLADAEYAILVQELENMRWNISKVARNLNVSRNTLYRKMKRYGIRPPR